MLRVKQLIGEIHRRSLWQVLGIYVAGSWGVLQAVEMVVENTPLPEWVQPLALVLLMIGLPVVAATAFVQEGIHPSAGAPSRDPSDSTDARERSGRRALLTWRRTLLAGVGVFAVLGLVAVAWVVRENAFSDRATLASVDDAAATTTFEQVGVDTASPVGDGQGAADSTAAEMDPPQTERSAEETNATDRAANGARSVAAPAPQTAPGGSDLAASRALEAFESARETARATRTAARSARINETVPALSAQADSVWDEAGAVAATGRYEDARGLMETAAELFLLASQQTETARRARLGALKEDVARLRDAADDGAPEYATAVTLEENAGRSEESGELFAAIADLTGAGALYRTVPRPAEIAQPEPVEEVRPSPRELVTTTLAELSQALYAEDIAAVRRVWVTLSGEQASNFETFFERRGEIRVSHAPDWSTLVSDGASIRVEVSTTWRYVEGSRQQEQPAFRQSFSFAERDGRWVIVAA